MINSECPECGTALKYDEIKRVEYCPACGQEFPKKMKPKRLLMIHHIDGHVDYLCRKCGAVMEHATSGGTHFSAGEAWDDIHEFLACGKCGHHEDYPKIKGLDNLEGISVHGDTVSRESTEVLGGESIG